MTSAVHGGHYVVSKAITAITRAIERVSISACDRDMGPARSEKQKSAKCATGVDDPKTCPNINSERGRRPRRMYIVHRRPLCGEKHISEKKLKPTTRHIRRKVEQNGKCQNKIQNSQVWRSRVQRSDLGYSAVVFRVFKHTQGRRWNAKSGVARPSRH